jgi:hypothetical protein
MTDPRGPFPTLALPLLSVALIGLGVNFWSITEALASLASASPSRLTGLIEDLLVAYWPVWTWALATAGGVLALRGPLEDIRGDLTALRRTALGRCVACDYDLRGCGTGRCPECGWSASSPDALAPEAVGAN